MLVFWDQKLILFSVPNGGADESELVTVASIRDPIDWLSSWYRYRHRDAIAGQPNSTRGISFDDFVLEYLKGKPAPFANLGSQSKFLLTGDGELGVDRLFRYENRSIQPWIEAELGISVTLNQKNVSPKLDTQLSPQVEEKYRRKYSADFALWEAAS